MSRVSLTIKNAWVALVFQIMYILMQFFSRDIFLGNLGDNFIGTVETLKSILQFLNLSELGIGTAVGFTLYKPLFNNDRKKINEIVGYLGFLYKRIGLFVLPSADRAHGPAGRSSCCGEPPVGAPQAPGDPKFSGDSPAH